MPADGCAIPFTVGKCSNGGRDARRKRTWQREPRTPERGASWLGKV